MLTQTVAEQVEAIRERLAMGDVSYELTLMQALIKADMARMEQQYSGGSYEAVELWSRLAADTAGFLGKVQEALK